MREGGGDGRAFFKVKSNPNEAIKVPQQKGT